MHGRLRGVQEGLIMIATVAFVSAGEAYRHARALASAGQVEGNRECGAILALW